MRLFRDKDGFLLAIPVTPYMSNASTGTVTNLMPSAIADSQPGSDGTNTFARAFGTPRTSNITDSTVGLVTNDRTMIWFPTGGAVSAGWGALESNLSSRTVSNVHAAQTVTFNSSQVKNMRHLMTILSVCSAGTSTLLVEVSVNGTDYYQVDSLAAAAANMLHYNETTLGTGTYATNPLAWPYVRVTAGDPGVGNTTTLNIMFAM